jgi:hypothetical protein
MANCCLTCEKPLLPRQFVRRSGLVHSTYTPKKYCSKKCAGIAASKIGRQLQIDAARGWSLDKNGYVILTARNGGNYQQPEHRAVMERMLGRKLEKHETVHHKNGDRRDNRPENLELWASRHGRGQRASDLEPDIWSGMIPAYQRNAEV